MPVCKVQKNHNMGSIANVNDIYINNLRLNMNFYYVENLAKLGCSKTMYFNTFPCNIWYDFWHTNGQVYDLTFVQIILDFEDTFFGNQHFSAGNFFFNVFFIHPKFNEKSFFFNFFSFQLKDNWTTFPKWYHW